MISARSTVRGLLAIAALVPSAPSLAGTSDPAGIADLIFIVIVGGLCLAMALSLFFAVLVSRGYFRLPAILLVVLFWGWLYQTEWQTKFVMPAKLERENGTLRSAAISQCKNEITGLETKFQVDGILDETASIGISQVVELLSHRKLQFVEFKVQPVKDQGTEIVFPTMGDMTDWIADHPTGTVVRVELGRVGDPLCKPLLMVLDEGKGFKSGTVPAGHCLKANFSLESNARYAISYSAEHPKNTRFGYWKIVDRQKNTVLAQLTTSDVGQSSMPNKPLSKGTELDIASWDCRFPHTILADRLLGADQSRTAHPQSQSRLN